MIGKGVGWGFTAGVAAAMLFAAPQPAAAEPIAVTVNTSVSIQQTLNSPCVIGDPSCQNPETFALTLLEPNQPAAVVSSPTYTVAQIREIVGGDTFVVGIDLNQSAAEDGGAFDLRSFSLNMNGTALFSTSGLMTLLPTNAGNGFSDAVLVGFNLAGLAPEAQLVFSADFARATAGREQFFLGAGDLNGGGGGGLEPVPEPTSILLVASGLAGAFVRYRRKSTEA